MSRGHSGRCARGGSVVRFLQRAVLCEVGKDGADGGGFFDAGHDPHRAAAVAAGAHVDVENALEALRPGHRAALFVGAAVVAVGPSRLLVCRRTFAARRWRQLRMTVFSVLAAQVYDRYGSSSDSQFTVAERPCSTLRSILLEVRQRGLLPGCCSGTRAPTAMPLAAPLARFTLGLTGFPVPTSSPATDDSFRGFLSRLSHEPFLGRRKGFFTEVVRACAERCINSGLNFRT